MSWAAQKQAKYVFGFIVAALIVIGIPAFFYLYDEPTCFDGVQNNDETGIDCGGSCEKVCNFEAAKPIVHWQQEFEVVPGVYTAVAYVENPNTAFEARFVSYVFRLRDSNNVLVSERKGGVYLPPHSIVPIFETGIESGFRKAVRTDFDFTQDIQWTQSSFELPDVDVLSTRLTEEENIPKLFVTLRNNTLDTFVKVPVVAILYDAKDNAIHSSKTIVSKLPSNEDTDIVFTWPFEFETNVARIEIVPLFSFFQ